MTGPDVGATVAFADYARDVEALRKQLADAQATVEALRRERDEAIEDRYMLIPESGDTPVTWEEAYNDAQAALDAEREKVKGLHEATKVICGHCCESMEIPSKAALQSHLSALQALVRALVCTMGYVVDGSYILTRGGVVLYACSSSISAERLGAVLAYRATLPATPTERGQE